jgi:glycerol kinase
VKAILALDQGTTSSRAILFDRTGVPLATAQRELRQIYPRPGWVEHDPREIAATQRQVAAEVVEMVPRAKVTAIGITNQRETTILWERATGQPIANAIVWQDRRTAEICDRLREHEPLIRERTGLVLDPYFSATKIRWLLDHAGGKNLAFGTVDSWLIWQLTGGRVHVTDATNASRTLLFDIRRNDWDDELLRLFGVPREMLPRVVSSSEVVGETEEGIPIAGIAGDQQAALHGQRCTRAGMAKNTYGTGCFIVMNTGERVVRSTQGLLSTRVCGGQYGLEGSIFVAGAAIQWLRDNLKIVRTAPEVEPLAASVPDSGGVVFVPAFTGLGAPHWDPRARGAILGITRGTTSAHLARAALEAIAFQTADILDAMRADSALPLTELRVDGGASRNDLLMQIQADVAGLRVVRSRVQETTALGAAYLAGLATGFWRDETEIDAHWQSDRVFRPGQAAISRERWREAIASIRSERSAGGMPR